MSTTFAGLPEVTEGQALAHVPHNVALAIIDVLLRGHVTDRVSATPGSPAHGDCYIIGNSPSGQWATDSRSEHDVAIRLSGAWYYFTPLEGWLRWVVDEDVFVRFTGSTWVEFRAAANANVTDSTGGTPGSAPFTLASIPNPGDSPADADALRDDLVANTLPAIRDAIAKLAASHNALQGAMRTARQLATALFVALTLGLLASPASAAQSTAGDWQPTPSRTPGVAALAELGARFGVGEVGSGVSQFRSSGGWIATAFRAVLGVNQKGEGEADVGRLGFAAALSLSEPSGVTLFALSVPIEYEYRLPLLPVGLFAAFVPGTAHLIGGGVVQDDLWLSVGAELGFRVYASAQAYVALSGQVAYLHDLSANRHGRYLGGQLALGLVFN